MMRVFSKPALSHEAMLQLLLSRGLICDDRERALNHLKHVGYYRLNGYARLLYADASERNPIFKNGTTYDLLWDLYTFDRELRLLTLDAIERIEVSVRTAISDTLCVGSDIAPLKDYPCGPHWYLKPQFYKEPERYLDFCSKISMETGQYSVNKRVPATAHYYESYDFPALPPSWVVMESLSMGKWTQALSNLKDEIQDVIAIQYGLPKKLFVSWMPALAWTRNVCAHHGRLLGRAIIRSPKAPDKKCVYCPDFSAVPRSYYAMACVAWYMLRKIVPTSTWSSRLQELFAKYPSVDAALLGFLPGWETDSFWGV